MTRRISDHEWRDLSAYLDGQLSPKESARLEITLQGRADLRAALQDLEHTRAILRSQPRLRAPRNFTLTAEVLGVHRSPKTARPPAFAFGFVSALASVMLVLVIAGELIFSGQPMGAVPVAMEAESIEMAAPQAPAAEIALTEAPAELRAAPQEMPAATKAVAAGQESAELSNKSLPPAAAPEPGVMEYPAPLAADAQALAIQTEETLTQLEPSPQPTASIPQVTEGVSIASAEQAADQVEPNQAAAPQGQPFWSGWRLVQAVLLFAALAFAVLALYLRRVGA